MKPFTSFWKEYDYCLTRLKGVFLINVSVVGEILIQIKHVRRANSPNWNVRPAKKKSIFLTKEGGLFVSPQIKFRGGVYCDAYVSLSIGLHLVSTTPLLLLLLN